VTRGNLLNKNVKSTWPGVFTCRWVGSGTRPVSRDLSSRLEVTTLPTQSTELQLLVTTASWTVPPTTTSLNKTRIPSDIHTPVQSILQFMCSLAACTAPDRCCYLNRIPILFPCLIKSLSNFSGCAAYTRTSAIKSYECVFGVALEPSRKFANAGKSSAL